VRLQQRLGEIDARPLQKAFQDPRTTVTIGILGYPGIFATNGTSVIIVTTGIGAQDGEVGVQQNVPIAIVRSCIVTLGQ